MMFDLLVFTQHPKAYAPTRLLLESKKLKLTIKVIDYTKIKKISLLPQSKKVILREPNNKDNLYELRDMVLNHYKREGSKVLNQKSYEKWSILDKKTQQIEFEKGNIPFIETISLKKAKYPFVVKNKLGSHGDSVYKIEKKEDLDKVLCKHNLKDLVVQEFQASGFDLRVIVFKGSVLGIMKRTPQDGEFLSNFSQGGTVTRYEVKNKLDIKGLEQIAIKTAKHFKLDYVGVDIMLGNDNKWKVLEVNRACQFQGFERATGVNVAKHLLNFF